MKLGRKFYKREDTVRVAKDLLGKLLVVPNSNGERVSGVIVETEAYLGEIDKAAHSFGGRRTQRNEATYAEGGTAYVFFIYGMYFQLNVVTGEAGSPHVVLVRAVDPVDGLDAMRERRGAMPDKNLTSGPGKLCIAMGIDRSYNGEDLLGERIWIEEYRKFPEAQIASGPRVGIDYAEEFVDMPWRFWVEGNPYVSKAGRKR